MGSGISNASIIGQKIQDKDLIYIWNGIGTPTTNIQLYAVPAGKKFYCIACGVCMTAVAGATDQYVRICAEPVPANRDYDQIIAEVCATDSDTAYMNNYFPVPIPMPAGSDIRLQCVGTTASSTHGWIIGWEE